MSSMTELTYRYAGLSVLDTASGRLRLSTSPGKVLSGDPGRPRFFSGFILSPDRFAVGLRAVAQVAASRYVTARAAGRSTSGFDPVVTANGDRLRFESFSRCGSVYARLDVLADVLDGDLLDRGTTNVDVNESLRRMLSGVRSDDVLHLAVGADELVVSTPEQSVVERRVALPQRWLRGFVETQQVASSFDLRMELSARDAERFLRPLVVKGDPGGWVLPAGRSWRLGGRPATGAVSLRDPRRLEAMLPLLRQAQTIRVYGPPAVDSELAASAWEANLPGMRLVLLLSPAAARGLSGEGGVLPALLDDVVVDDAERLGELLEFDARIEPAELAQRSGLSRPRVQAALICLGLGGQVGYDLAEAAWFHRELPFDQGLVATLNPRLVAARGLVDRHALRQVDADSYEVTSGDAIYLTRRRADGSWSCTCRWWLDHHGSRGPCKHALATRIVHHDEPGKESSDFVRGGIGADIGDRAVGVAEDRGTHS